MLRFTASTLIYKAPKVARLLGCVDGIIKKAVRYNEANSLSAYNFKYVNDNTAEVFLGGVFVSIEDQPLTLYR